MGRNQKDLAGGGCIEVMPTEQFGYDIVIGTSAAVKHGVYFMNHRK